MTKPSRLVIPSLNNLSPLAGALGLVALPPLYWLWLAGMLVTYMFLTQLVKTWFYRRFGD